MDKKELIAEGRYLARSSTDQPFNALEIRLYKPERQGDGPFKGMWTCQCEFSGVVEYSQAFPGVDSLAALEYTQVMTAAYFGHLCKEYDVRRPSASGDPKPLPLLAQSFLASLLQGKEIPQPV